MRHSFIIFALVSLAAPAAAAQTPEPPRNLQVLPDTMTRAAVVARMRNVASALGVQCLHCHEGTTMRDINYASDSKESKRTAREMMRMLARINTDLEGVLPGRGAQIDCITCHRGATRPQMLEDTLHNVLRAHGLARTIAVYDSLRARYYGRFAFDFGQRSLNTLATRVADEGDLELAIRIFQFNGEHFPASWDIPYEIGLLLERLDRPQEAIAQYRRVLELLPTHTGAVARLEQLQGRD